jgi:Bacterial protein of unknown function (DUF899)
MANDGDGIKGHPVVSHKEWLSARTALLKKEKEFTRLRDELSRQRRELPWERVDKKYVLVGPKGKENVGRALRKQEPVDRLSLHVRSRRRGRVQALLVLGRQLQRHRCSLESARRDLCCHFPGPACQTRLGKDVEEAFRPGRCRHDPHQ